MGRLLLAALVFVTWGVPAVARADDAGAPVAAAAPSATDDAAPGQEPDTAQQELTPQLEISGRVFARAEADERAEYSRDLSIPSARFGVKASYGFAQAVLEADVASKSIIKDAYIRLEDDGRDLRLYAGHFKAPLLSRTTESRWNLPLIDRGLLDSYLVEQNQLGGRRIGVMGQLRKKSWLGLDVQVGAFQGAEDDRGQRVGEDLSARASFEPWKKRLELGATGYWADFTNGMERYVAGADATLRWAGARVTAEALTGKIAIGNFTAQVLTTSYLLPLGESGKWAVEPVLGAEALQLRGPISGQGNAAVVGLNVHYTERIKLMVQGERGLFPGDDSLKNRFAVQLAARF